MKQHSFQVLERGRGYRFLSVTVKWPASKEAISDDLFGTSEQQDVESRSDMTDVILITAIFMVVNVIPLLRLWLGRWPWRVARPGSVRLMRIGSPGSGLPFEC